MRDWRQGKWLGHFLPDSPYINQPSWVVGDAGEDQKIFFATFCFHDDDDDDDEDDDDDADDEDDDDDVDAADADDDDDDDADADGDDIDNGDT